MTSSFLAGCKAHFSNQSALTRLWQTVLASCWLASLYWKELIETTDIHQQEMWMSILLASQVYFIVLAGSACLK